MTITQQRSALDAPPQPPDGPKGAGPAAVTRRSITPRLGLPSGRAVVGGFLLLLAVVGVLASYRSSDEDGHRALFIARDVPSGVPLTAADLAWGELGSRHGLADRVFDQPEALVGKVTVAPLRKGDLVQASAVVTPDAAAPGVHTSFAVARARALDGRVEVGALVDVAAVGNDRSATIVAAGAQVVAVGGADRGGLGSTGELVLTVQVASTDQALAVQAAAHSGTVALLRTVGLATPPLPAPSAPAGQPPADVSSVPGPATGEPGAEPAPPVPQAEAATPPSADGSEVGP